MTNKGLPHLPSIDWYKKELESMIQCIKSHSNAKIAISTLPWIGERASDDIISVVKEYNNIIKNIASKYDLILIDFFSHLSKFRGNNSASHPYETTQWRTLRVLRAKILHNVFSQNWNQIGKKYGLKALCDHIHLNEDAGMILENEIREFLDE